MQKLWPQSNCHQANCTHTSEWRPNLFERVVFDDSAMRTIKITFFSISLRHTKPVKRSQLRAHFHKKMVIRNINRFPFIRSFQYTLTHWHWLRRFHNKQNEYKKNVMFGKYYFYDSSSFLIINYIYWLDSVGIFLFIFILYFDSKRMDEEREIERISDWCILNSLVFYSYVVTIRRAFISLHANS